MINYIKLGKVRGISLEINPKLGLKPFFRKNSFARETIIDIPCVQIIYTSEKWCAKKRVPIRSATNVNEEAKQITECSKRTHSHRS